MKNLFVAVVMLALTASCCGPCLVPCIPGVWPRPASPAAADQRGAFLLENGDRVQFHRDGGHHRIELHRPAERDERTVLQWELLDSVDIPATPNLFVCMGAAYRDGDPTEYIAVAEEDPAQVHPVKFAWRIDTATQKLIAANPSGLRCDVE